MREVRWTQAFIVKIIIEEWNDSERERDYSTWRVEETMVKGKNFRVTDQDTRYW